MEFHPETLVITVDKAVSMTAEAVHMAVALWQTTVTDIDGQLVEGFRQMREKVPLISHIAQVGARVTFYHVVQIREFQRVTKVEHRRVVTDHVPVTFLGIKFQGKAADVALCICGAALTGHGGEAGKHIGFFTDLRENFCAGKTGNIMGDGKCTECTGAFGVHTALRDHFAVKMRQFFQKPHIL